MTFFRFHQANATESTEATAAMTAATIISVLRRRFSRPQSCGPGMDILHVHEYPSKRAACQNSSGVTLVDDGSSNDEEGSLPDSKMHPFHQGRGTGVSVKLSRLRRRACRRYALVHDPSRNKESYASAS